MIKPNYFQDYYNRNADEYYSRRIAQEKGFINDMIESPSIMDLIDFDLANQNILDIGCGFGKYAGTLARQGANVVGIDCSRKMLEYAIKLNPNPRINFINVSFEELDKDRFNNYDLILGTFMLSYFKDLDLLFSKANELLKNTGCLILSMLHPSRLNSKRLESSSYKLENYFDTKTLYSSDFISDTEPIKLKKWTIEDISVSAKSNEFWIDEIKEPSGVIDENLQITMNHKKFSSLPSVIIFKFVKRV